MVVADVFFVNLLGLGPKENSHEELLKQSSPWEYLIPLEQKYEAILCLFPLEMVLIGPIEEPAEGMLEAGGELAHLGLGVRTTPPN